MAINIEMACGKESCSNPFNCKVAACDFGEAVRAQESMASNCANNGGCKIEKGETPGCLAGNCKRAVLIGMGKRVTLPIINNNSITTPMQKRSF